jgi:hypothetical protein
MNFIAIPCVLKIVTLMTFIASFGSLLSVVQNLSWRLKWPLQEPNQIDDPKGGGVVKVTMMKLNGTMAAKRLT